MEKEKEDWLKILNYLNTYGFKPYDEIAAWGKQLFEDEEQFKIVFIRMYEDGLIIQDRNKPLPVQGEDYLHKYLMGISQPGKLRMQALKHEKNSEQSAEKGTREVSGWTKWGAIGAWVAAGLTFIGIIITLYFGCNPLRSNESYSKAMDSIALARFNHALDSINKITRVQTIDSSGAVLDSEIPSPPMPKTRLRRKTTRPVKSYDCADSLDPLPPERRRDTLNIDNLPVLQKEIEKNTKSSGR
jgi:hypothetical protein